jgi:hypothetical protein
MRQSALTGPVMLNSWKEIASYLDRGVRTVQRWERELQLPVHRIGKGKRSPVYAIATEVKLWLCTAEIPHAKKTPVKRIVVSRSVRPVDDSIRLLSAAQSLVQTVAQNSILQTKQTEMLRTRMAQMRQLRARMKGDG